MIFNENRSVIVCGIGFQTETIIEYLKKNHINVTCVLIDCFTQQPERCYLIPSKREIKRNSFSEVDMMMDNTIYDVPVKRFDMLTKAEKTELFLVSDDTESQKVFSKIKTIENIDFYMLTHEELVSISSEIWTNNKLSHELWKTNKYLYSEVELLKNCLRRQLKSTVYDFHFEFHLVEHCNLKCAGCTHFSSIAKEEFIDIEEFRRDITRLSELTDGKTRFINLLGGEPLLHPQVSDFFYVVRQAFPSSIIRVVTNGIRIMEMDNNFWESCRINHIVIGITQYPINIDYNQRIKRIINENVKYESFSGEEMPRDEMWRLSLDENASSRPVENFMRCPRANACIFVSHGRVFNCATMANIEHFNKCFGTKFEISEDDFVDIYKCKNIDEVFEKLCNPKPFCRYCNIEKRRYGVKWEQTKRKKEEWV